MDDARAATGSRVLALVGATASGKSALAMEAAERLGAEIVAVDAFTVYRGMDVGTAKPSQEDRSRVAHHCVDLLHPGQECSVSWFQQVARGAIDDLLARGVTPLLVGGAGLYFRAVVDPLEFPPTDPALRDAILTRLGHDPPAAHAELATRDPDAAAAMDPGNLRRAVRALEVLELTGRPFSDWRRTWDSYKAVYPGLRVVGVRRTREDLVTRIEERVDGMIEGGLVEESRRLLAGALSPTARQAIGYAELFTHLEGHTTLAQAVERINARTRQFSARQTRWFTSDPRVRWLAPSAVVEVLTACDS